MIKHLKTTCISAIALLMTGITYAKDSNQEAIEELSLEALYALPFIEIATGTAVPLEKAPSVASLITAEDIKAMGALTLDEVLESVPGLHVSPSTYDSAATFSIRGIKTGLTPQVLILLNGYRISSDVLTGTFPFLAKINVQNISRIEIIRGPGSAVYGADAFSGVIDIITKSAKELDGFHLGLKSGSNNTRNFWSQYGGEIGNGWNLAINLEHASQDADKSQKVTSDQQTIFDPIANGFGYPSASLAPGYLNYRYTATSYNLHLNNKNWKFGLDGWNQRDNGTGAGNALALDHKGHADTDQYLFTLEYNDRDLIKDWDLKAKLSYQYIDAQYNLNLFPAGTVLPIGSDGNVDNPITPLNPPIGFVSFPDGLTGNPGRKSRIPQFDMIALYNGLLDHSWRFNLGMKKEILDANETKNFGPGVIDGTVSAINGNMTNVTGTPFIYATDEERSIKYMSIQDVWEINIDWTLTAGIRYDKYSDFGSTTNSRLALVWSTTDEIITKFMYGSAFRAPSFAELYVQNTPVLIGNNNLKPEKIDTYELSTSWQPISDITTNLSIYHYTTRDMIDFIPNGNAGTSAKNDKSLRGKGAEIELKWKINKQWDIRANYAYQRTKNKKTHKQEPYIPKQQFYLDARWKFLPDWSLNSQLTWIGDTERASGDNRKPIDDYNLVNMTLRRQNIAKNWEFAASIKNLFNNDAREPSTEAIPDDYPLNDRRAYIELRYHIN